MLYLGDSGRTLLALKLGYELLLTQRLSLEPEVKMHAASASDNDTETSSGLNQVEAGLRLRYAVSRKFAPYLGVVWEKAYGDSADFIQQENGDPELTRWTAGVSFWF